MRPLNRESALRLALGKKIQRSDCEAGPINVLGVTDEGMFLGDMECGPFITYEWALRHCVFSDSLQPVGISETTP